MLGIVIGLLYANQLFDEQVRMPSRGRKEREGELGGRLWLASRRHRLERFANGIVAGKSGQSYGTGCRCFRSQETFRSLVICTICFSPALS